MHYLKIQITHYINIVEEMVKDVEILKKQHIALIK